MREFTQGATLTTTGLLDGAIQGDGFFIVKDSQGAQDFTRAGNFQVTMRRLPRDPGRRARAGMGQDADGVVDTNQPIGDIPVPVGTLKAPIASTRSRWASI